MVDAARAVLSARALLERSSSFSLASDELVTGLLGGIAELTRVVDALQVRLAAQLAERSRGPADQALCKKLGARSAKEAIAAAFGSRSREAADLLALAAATTATVGVSGGDVAARYPRVGQALGEGELSLPQALAIVQVLEPAAPRADLGELAWAEGALVDAATDADGPLGPELLTVQGRVYAALLDPDGLLPDAERQQELRSLTIGTRRDGMIRTVLISPPEDGALLKSVRDAWTGPRAKVRFQETDGPESTDDGPIEHADGCDGQGCEGCGRTRALSDGEATDERTLAQKGHDVMLGIVRAAAMAPGAPTAGGAPATLVLTGTIAAYEAYLQGSRHRDAFLRIEHTGDVLPIEWVEGLLCSGDVQLGIADEHHHPLALGREQRLFTPAQRRALAQRDQGCAVRGCGMPPSWCEAHHVRPWQAGGTTDVDNGILLCSHHHHEVHAGRLRIERVGQAPGRWRIVSQARVARVGRGAWIDDVVAASLDEGAAEAAATAAHAARAAAGGGSMAAAAPPSLAVRIPEPPPAGPTALERIGSPHEPPATRAERCMRARLRRRTSARCGGGFDLRQMQVVLRR
ncbi:hypothetical protein ABA31_17960 [Agrococcus baldri]|uniref:HNH nuclease domain-containing protein n=2 Tax=Agrococcus baldri TaxID=153730 RepID=A0AA87USJ2_9MICO|nr:hypothetical protein ABA31_17960 [Agrococcus baldri]